MIQVAQRASTARALTDVDLSYPNHVTEDSRALVRRIGDLALTINGLVMRHYIHPGLMRSAFTNFDRFVRRQAIELTKRGIDAARAMGAPLSSDVETFLVPLSWALCEIA